MKNILKTLAIALVLSFTLTSCSKCDLDPKASDHTIYVKAFGPPQYTGYIQDGNYCGDIVSNKISYIGDKVVYEVRVKSDNNNDYASGSYGTKITQWFQVTYKKSDVQPNYIVGDKFCVDRIW